MTPVAQVGRTIADAGGRVLAGATHLVADLRATEKPLHPHGRLVRARLIRYGAPQPTGVRWLDEGGDDEALVRTSRAIGTPPRLPDFHGLAVRVPDGGAGYADLLFATTAWNRIGRHVLVPTLATGPTLSTLLPYKTAAGPVVLGARHVGTAYQLYWAPVGGGWSDLGELRMETAEEPDAVVSFDPVLHHPPGLTPYPWVARLRERSYAVARASRR